MRRSAGYRFALLSWMRFSTSTLTVLLTLATMAPVARATAASESSAPAQTEPRSVAAAEVTTAQQKAPANAKDDLRASLRMTQLMFAAVLGEYFKDGRSEYRPDFLLQERYLRTFLYEWGLILENQKAVSTIDAWNQIAARNSYLGANFDVWKRTLPNYFKLGNSASNFNLGYRRESFLASLVASEAITSFDARSKKVLDLIARDLYSEIPDVFLAERLFEVYDSHTDRATREQAARYIRNADTYTFALFSLRSLRNMVFGFGAGGPGALLRIGSGGKALLSPLARAFRFKEIATLWTKAPGIAKAGVASVGLHAAGFALTQPRSGESSSPSGTEATENFSETTPPATAFIATLALYTASDASPRLVEQNDFALPARPMPKVTKPVWIAQGRQMLSAWNSDRLPKGLANYFLEGDQLRGLWPKDEKLARLTLQSRYARMKKRIAESQINNIEELRENILTMELEDYRGDSPSITSMMLDWGGNCVSQTLSFVSLLTDFPQLVPKDAVLGVYISPTHLEAVLVRNNGDVQFLVSGEVRKNDSTFTVLKPQALILMALRGMGDKQTPASASYYLAGKPASDVKEQPSQDGLGNETTILPLLGKAKKVDAPAHAVIDFTPTGAGGRSDAESTGEDNAESAFFSRLLPTSSFQIKQNPQRVRVGQQDVEVCLSYRTMNKMMTCRFRRRFEKPFEIRGSGVQNFKLQQLNKKGDVVKEWQRTTYNQIEFPIEQKDAQTWLATPKELWVLRSNRIYLTSIMNALGLSDSSIIKVDHAKALKFDAADVSVVQSYLSGLKLPAANAWVSLLVNHTKGDSDVKGLPAGQDSGFTDLVKASLNYRTWLAGLSIDTKILDTTIGRPDPIIGIQEWFKYQNTLIQTLNRDPRAFVSAYPSFTPEMKQALLNWGRSSKQALESLQPFRTFLAQLKSEQLVLDEPLTSSKAPCTSTPIQTYQCKTAEGCKAFRQIKVLPLCSATRAAEEKQSSREKPDTFRLSTQDLAEITLLGRSGWQLWNDKTFATVDRAFDGWMNRQLQADYSLRLFAYSETPSQDLRERKIEEYMFGKTVAWFEKTPAPLPPGTPAVCGPGAMLYFDGQCKPSTLPSPSPAPGR